MSVVYAEYSRITSHDIYCDAIECPQQREDLFYEVCRLNPAKKSFQNGRLGGGSAQTCRWIDDLTDLCGSQEQYYLESDLRFCAREPYNYCFLLFNQLVFAAWELLLPSAATGGDHTLTSRQSLLHSKTRYDRWSCPARAPVTAGTQRTHGDIRLFRLVPLAILILSFLMSKWSIQIVRSRSHPGLLGLSMHLSPMTGTLMTGMLTTMETNLMRRRYGWQRTYYCHDPFSNVC